MTEVLFYISDTPGIRATLAGRIADKAWRQQRQVYIHLPDREQALAFSDQLWQSAFCPFLPHVLQDDPGAGQSPIVLGFTDQPGECHDVLINLAAEVPDFYGRFSRVAEMICGDPSLRTEGRARWSFYRDRGYPVRSHTL